MNDPFGNFVGDALQDDRTKMAVGMAGSIFNKVGSDL
jgi:hypothetical protein